MLRLEVRGQRSEVSWQVAGSKGMRKGQKGSLPSLLPFKLTSDLKVKSASYF